MYESADKVVHAVEDQWHYKILHPRGWVPLTKSDVGLVRNYKYSHPDHSITISCCTGVYADHWTSSDKAHGYWADLLGHAKRLAA